MVKTISKKITKKLRPVTRPQLVRKTQVLDATDQILGRFATQIAIMLRGKNKATFQPHLDEGDVVIIKNASKIKVTGNKMRGTNYYRHSQYQGHLKTQTMAEIYAKNPAILIRTAVWNMLPKNKLRDRMIKRLTITN